MLPEQNRSSGDDELRYISDPATAACFSAVTRIWHLPSGHALLEREHYRDCLLPAVDRIYVPTSGCERVGDVVAIDTRTTVEVVARADERVLTEIDINVKIG